MGARIGSHNCGVCRHPQRAEIEVALAAGLSYPSIARQFWITPELARYHVERAATLQAEAERAKRREQEANDGESAL